MCVNVYIYAKRRKKQIRLSVYDSVERFCKKCCHSVYRFFANRFHSMQNDVIDYFLFFFIVELTSG